MSVMHNISWLSNTSYGQREQNFSIHKSKVSPSRRLKNILKPLLGRVFKSKLKLPKRSSYIASEENDNDYDWLRTEKENIANEQLENQLIEEVHECSDGAAIVVFNENGSRRLQMFNKEDIHVPVHFARTQVGTFFWTSVRDELPTVPYQIEWNFLDRWAQA